MICNSFDYLKINIIKILFILIIVIYPGDSHDLYVDKHAAQAQYHAETVSHRSHSKGRLLQHEKVSAG